ncbi:iron-sulfur cluster assembly scaffold protein [Sulfurovum sp. ST-21]|uniref:Iron-sulfur cluster assembly scaffold protein n=1 Tax=Sulfurovum indicum TaxID=2779528 RepID=A0A7M1S5L3_9BACT|nr:iron-sulfur cluster assembly scaffold protein [Sulfurovum indicum]QOR61660.1 iron-sulfur cluster assembly scaffold protein [Sulfurovum indicum]
MITEEDLKAHGYNVNSEQTKVLNEHYHDPKNRWALKEYNARGIGRNPDNYGQVDMYVLVNESEEIDNVGYEFNGCPTIAFSASIFTEEIKGILLEEAFLMTQASLEEMAAKDNCEECTAMILVAFLAAYENYRNRQKGMGEEFVLKMIETSLRYSEQSCG